MKSYKRYIAPLIGFFLAFLLGAGVMYATTTVKIGGNTGGQPVNETPINSDHKSDTTVTIGGQDPETETSNNNSNQTVNDPGETSKEQPQSTPTEESKDCN